MSIIRTKNASPKARKLEDAIRTTAIDRTTRNVPVPMLRSVLCTALGSVDKSIVEGETHVLKRCHYSWALHEVTVTLLLAGKS